MGLVTHRRHFNAASQRSHTGEPPTRHIFSSRRAAVRAHSVSKNGVRRRPPRPSHAPSGGVPLVQTGGVRAQAPVQHREPNSPQMRVLPPPPNQSRRRGVRHVWQKHTHDGRRRPLSRCRRSSLGCPSVAACGEGSGGMMFVLASGGRAKGSGGEREQTADSAKCGLLVSHLLLVSPSHGRRFPGRSPSPAPRPSPRPSSSSLPPLRPLRRSRRAGSWPDARDAGADLLRALRPGPPPLLPPVLPVVLAGERVPFAGLSPERVSPRPSSDLFCGLGLCALRCAARLEARRNTARVNGVMDEPSIPDGRGGVP